MNINEFLVKSLEKIGVQHVFGGSGQVNASLMIALNESESIKTHIVKNEQAASFMAENPEIVQKVIDIHAEAETWIIANPAEAIQIAVDWLEMDETPVTTSFNNIIFDYNLNRTGIEMYLEFLIHEDFIITANIPPDTSAFLDSFLNTTFVDNLLLCC